MATLLNHGACVDAATLACGATPLHFAAAADATPAAGVLLRAGAEQSRDHEGQIPLHAAASAGASACVALLLQWNASDVNAVDAFGFSPLRWACLNGHARVVELLLESGADAVSPVDELTPLALAAAAGHSEVVKVLLCAGIEDTLDGQLCSRGGSTPTSVTAFEMAIQMGHEETAALFTREAAPAHAKGSGAPNGHAAAPMHAGALGGTTSEAATTQVGKEAVTMEAGREVVITEVSADELVRDRTAWDNAFWRSTPLLVRGCGTELAQALSSLSVRDLSRRWAANQVCVCFSPDPLYHRPVRFDRQDKDAAKDSARARGRQPAPLPDVRIVAGPAEWMTFAEYVDMLPAHGQGDFFAVSQSPAESAEDFHTLFEGLPNFPPLLEALIDERSHQSGPELRRVHGRGEYYRTLARGVRRNLWVCSPPKVSALHFDTDDSVLLQLSGTKRFTLFAPAPLHGLTAYPRTLPCVWLERRGPGDYRTVSEALRSRAPQPPSMATNFGSVNASAPDLEVHPLARHARVGTVEVAEGDALLLPAFWYHEVESSISTPAQLNVAVNIWFSSEHGSTTTPGGLDHAHTHAPKHVPPSRLHRVLRQRLQFAAVAPTAMAPPSRSQAGAQTQKVAAADGGFGGSLLRAFSQWASVRNR